MVDSLPVSNPSACIVPGNRWKRTAPDGKFSLLFIRHHLNSRQFSFFFIRSAFFCCDVHWLVISRCLALSDLPKFAFIRVDSRPIGFCFPDDPMNRRPGDPILNVGQSALICENLRLTFWLWLRYAVSPW